MLFFRQHSACLFIQLHTGSHHNTQGDVGGAVTALK